LYLRGGWRFRRTEIIGSLSEEGCKSYFQTFPPSREYDTTNPIRAFETHYDKRFGRRHYALPIIALLFTSLVAVAWSCDTILGNLGVVPARVGVLPPVALSALAGAYVAVLADIITRWRTRDLGPVDLWWASLRFVLAAPLGYAFSAVAAENIGFSLAFLAGAFPTNTLFTIMRRIGRRHLNLADEPQGSARELEKLQGVDSITAERFADEGVTTIVQLAYCDPIELTMRCPSVSFSFVVDCASQALAWLYLEDALAGLRKYSLRGAQEIWTIVEESKGEPAESGPALRTMRAAATELKLDPEVLQRTLAGIAEDPYTEFLADVWQPGRESTDLVV
jgi:hypothetical protein